MPAAEASDDELLSRSVTGDEDAFALLLERHGMQVRTELRLARKWQSVVDVDDIMQVTYVEAFLRIADFAPEGPGAFRAWLRRIAENNLKDAVKELERVKRPHPDRRVQGPDESSYLALIEQLSGTQTTPSTAAAGREAVSVIERTLRQLPADYERVVRLYELEGRPVAEVAEAIGRSRGAVKMLLARARDRLRELLGSGSQFFSGPA